MTENQNYYSGTVTQVDPVTYNENKIPQLSFGEKLVGITFNPANDDKVHKLKSLFAEAANIVQDQIMQNRGKLNPYSNDGQVSDLVGNQALTEILKAQMCAVKLVTLKY